MRYAAIFCTFLAGAAWGDAPPWLGSKPDACSLCKATQPLPRYMPSLPGALPEARKALTEAGAIPLDLEISACGQQPMDPSVLQACQNEFVVDAQWPPAGTRLVHGKASIKLRLVRKPPAAPYILQNGSPVALPASPCAAKFPWHIDLVPLSSNPAPGSIPHALAPVVDGLACRMVVATVMEPPPPSPPLPLPPPPAPSFPAVPAALLGGLGGLGLMRLARSRPDVVATAAAMTTRTPSVPAMRVHRDHPG